MKQWESELDSCLGANGAMYATRRELFWSELPVNTIVDDFVIGMKVREQGYRMVYDPEALAAEDLPQQRDEWRRRVRIGIGDYQALMLCRRCLRPLPRRVASTLLFPWFFWSHKILRWFTPHLLLLLLVVALTAWGRQITGVAVWMPIYAAILCGYAVALAGILLARTLPTPPRLLAALDHFATMQCALLTGFTRFLCGRNQGPWARTPRAGGR